MRETTSAANIVLAEPVSIRTWGTVTAVPPCASVTVTNGSLSLSVSCITTPNTYPGLFSDIQFFAASMHVVELAERILVMQASVTLQSRAAIRATFYYSDAFQLPLVIWRRLGVEC